MQSINTATWPAALVRNSKIIDNPWASSIARAEKAGQVIADAILNKIGGERPVNLIGYGAGARAVWVALMVLAEKRAFGFIESAVLIGSPCPSNVQSWAAARGTVAGRLVNVYSKNDIMLGFAMRSCNFTEGIAGLEEIVGVPGVENFDASKIIHAHGRYRYLIGALLRKLDYEDVVVKESLGQEAKLHEMIREEEKRDAFREEIVRKVAAARMTEEQQGTSIATTKAKTAALATEKSKV